MIVFNVSLFNISSFFLICIVIVLVLFCRWKTTVSTNNNFDKLERTKTCLIFILLIIPCYKQKRLFFWHTVTGLVVMLIIERITFQLFLVALFLQNGTHVLSLKILFATPCYHGHITPSGGIARALINHGHQVDAYISGDCCDTLVPSKFANVSKCYSKKFTNLDHQILTIFSSQLFGLAELKLPFVDDALKKVFYAFKAFLEKKGRLWHNCSRLSTYGREHCGHDCWKAGRSLLCRTRRAFSPRKQKIRGRARTFSLYSWVKNAPLFSTRNWCFWCISVASFNFQGNVLFHYKRANGIWRLRIEDCGSVISCDEERALAFFCGRRWIIFEYWICRTSNVQNVSLDFEVF